MMDQPKSQPRSERRKKQRFEIQAPAVVTVESGEIWAFTKEVSSCGIYFSVAEDNEEPSIGEPLDFVIKILPRVKCSKPCFIEGRARIIRIDQTDQNETGIAVEILKCAIQDKMPHGTARDQSQPSLSEPRAIR
jgi:hypothetical protein